MFKALRKMIFPIIIIVLVFFSAMIVLEWGMGMSGRRDYSDLSVAAIINGEEVDWRAYRSIYNNLYQAEATKTEDGELPEKKIRELHEQAWQMVLSEILLNQEVEKYEITVTDEELFAYLRTAPPSYLQQLPYFQTEGRFDYQKYINSMADPSASSFWAQVEPTLRKEMRRMKVQELVVQTVHVTEGEIRQHYLESQEKIKVGLVNVPYARYSRPSPVSTDEEMRAFYEERKDEYTLNERVALNLAILDKNPAPQDWEMSFARIDAIHDSIEAGADFAEMAKRYSEDGTAEGGGDLGWFPRGQMVSEFDRMAFSMKEGELSESVRTQYGWHILFQHGFKEEMDTPRGQSEQVLMKKTHVSHILIKASVSQETLDNVFRRVEEFKIAADKDGFLTAAKELNMPVKNTGFFFRGRNIQYLGSDAKAGLFGFDSEVDDISPVFENQNAFYVVQVAEKRPAGPANYEEAEEKVKIDIVKYKVATMCTDTGQAIYAEIQAGSSMAKAAKKYGFEYIEPDPFTRLTRLKDVGGDPAMLGAAFSLTEPGQMTAAIDHGQGTVIFKLIERFTPEMSDFTAKHDSVSQVVRNLKQQQVYARWFEDLILNSEIVNNVEKSLAEETDFL